MGEQIRPELVDQASDTVGNDVSVSFDIPAGDGGMRIWRVGSEAIAAAVDLDEPAQVPPESAAPETPAPELSRINPDAVQ